MSFTKHLEMRGLSYTHCFIDEAEELVTFPIWSATGQLVGIQQYDWRSTLKGENTRDCRYFNIRTPCVDTFYGAENLSYDSILYVVEGIWDAQAIRNTGRDAIAATQNNPVHLRNWLSLYPKRTVAACDGDKAGLKLRKYTDSYVLMPIGEDPSSLGLERLNKILCEFERGLWLTLQ